MNEIEFESAMYGALEVAYDEDQWPVDGVWSFEEAGLLTRNRGLVVRMADGDEFEITIVRSN